MQCKVVVWCSSSLVPLHFGFGNGCVCRSVFCMILCERVARSLTFCQIIIASSREELYRGLGC